MKALAATLICAAMALGAGSASAADDAMTKKPDGMAKDNMMKDGMGKPMTLQECKDHMAMSKKDGMKKDDAMMKKDTMCDDMMKKDGAMSPGMMASQPMKK